METKKTSNKKSMCNSKKLGIFLSIITMLVILCAGCGKKESSSIITDVNEETAVEESAEVGQSVEEDADVAEESTEEAPVEEVQAEELSDEEWFKSLNLDTAKFMIFNEVTGERKLLENGQQYTLLEGDVLAYWYPLEWLPVSLEPAPLYNDTELKFDCIFLDLNYGQIGENTELTLHVKDTDGNDIYATVYLSK